MPKRIAAPREPRAAEAAYIAALRKVWGVSQAVIAEGVAQLMAAWPEPVETVDEDYNPFGPPPPRPRTAWRMTDAQLRREWPSFDPEEIRDYAPWATSRSEAERLAPHLPRTTEAMDGYLRRAIGEAQRAAPLPDIRNFKHGAPPGPQAFRLRPRVPPPVVLGADGIPLPPPPRPTAVSTETIRRQVEWMELQIGNTITVENLAPVIDATGARVDRWNRRELERVLAIDLRAELPGLQAQIDRWRDLNVGLIESGVRGPSDGVRLRSLLEDVSETIERGHAQGIRVETLAADLQERFGVSDSRAELIARDQVLKLNAQVNQTRQQSAGITEYRWSTSRDERVRRTHRRLHNTIQSWDNPPPVGGGQHEHPGGSVQCRCTASPVLPARDEFGENFEL